jgi:hypothetical protein
MNTLTKNRILEPGDEYKDGDKWKAIPKIDLGLQIMFTKYEQVRRPSEKPPEKILSAVPVLADPASEAGEARESTNVKSAAFSEQDSRGGALPPPQNPPSGVKPKPSGAGTTSAIIEQWVKEKVEARFPRKDSFMPVKIPPAGIAKIPFPKGSPPCVWTGRNGTFNGKGIDMRINEDALPEFNKIQIRAVGVRGLGNCLIEFPASIIPEMVDWLLRMQTTTPKT